MWNGSRSSAQAVFQASKISRKACVTAVPTAWGSVFNLIADSDVVDGCLLAGDYLVSPGWLADWPACLDRLGLNRETAREMFRETTSRVVLLDTGVGETSDSLLHRLPDTWTDRTR